MAIADELVAILGYDLRGEANLRKYQSSIDGLQSKLIAFGAVAGKVAALAAGALAGGFALMGKGAISASAQMEGYLTSMETIEGSAEKAKQSMDWIKEFAKVTPYELDGVTESFIKLKSYGIDPVANNTLRTLGDMASAMNKPLNQAVEAFADASTFEFERLKEFGVKAKQEGDNVTFSWTENNKEMSKSVKKTATDVRAFLLDVAGRRFGGAMEKQSKTFTGMMSNLTDSWEDFKRRIGEKGFFEVVKTQLGGLLDQISRLDKSGKLDAWAQGISSVLSRMAGFFATIASRIAVNVEWILDNFDKLKGPLMVLGAALGVLVAWAMPVATAFVAAALALDDFFAYLQGGESYIGDFIKWIQKLAGVEFPSWADAGKLLAQGLIAGFDTITKAGANLIGYLTDLFMNADWAAVGTAIANAIEGAFKGIGTFLISFLSELGNQIKPIFLNLGSALGQALLDGLSSMGGAIRDWFASLVPGWAKDMVGGGPGSQTGADVGKLIGERAKNLQGNVAKTGDGKAVAAVANDNRQDNSDRSLTVNTTVNQTVSQATSAPGQAAQATGSAVSGAVASQRSQVETGPAF